jgi:hypothetical protein
MPTPPYIEPAAPILSQSLDVNDDDRAELFDIFHDSKSSDELASKLQTHDAPDELKQQLIGAKRATDVPPSAVDKTVGALKRLAQVDPRTLDLAESHPNVMKLVLDAAARGAR